MTDSGPSKVTENTTTHAKFVAGWSDFMAKPHLDDTREHGSSLRDLGNVILKAMGGGGMDGMVLVEESRDLSVSSVTEQDGLKMRTEISNR